MLVFHGRIPVLEDVCIIRVAAHPAMTQVFLAGRAPVCARCACDYDAVSLG